MLPILEEPAVRERMRIVSVAEYHRMILAGSLAENLELIRGALVEKKPKSSLHSSIVEMLRDHFVAVFPSDCFLRQEQPLTFEDSEPEPDLAIIRGSRNDFRGTHPTTAALVIEVVVTSERLDRIKLELYAEAGIPETWLILAEERIVERHTQPQGAAYTRLESAPFPATLESTLFPGLTLPPPAYSPAE